MAALERLYKAGVTPRRGEFIMIAGEPGTQKSGFALWWMQEMGLPTLYFSADMNNFQVSVRLAAARTGRTTEQVKDDIRAGDMDGYLNLLDESRIQFCYDSHPTLDDIESQLEAYVEIFDDWPEVIVVDNLMDVESERELESDNRGIKEICAFGHDLTRHTGSTVIYLHHMTEGNPKHNSAYPHPRKDIIQKVSNKFELILSNSLDGQEFRLNCAKQRMGPSDRSGSTYITLRCDAERATFERYSGYRPTQEVTTDA